MKRTHRNIISLLLAVCLLFSLMPTAAFAVDNEGNQPTTTNGHYDENGNWVAGGDGTATYDVDGTQVTLGKTATPVEGQENVFDITLTVTTSTTTSAETAAGAVVLVIDLSNSMKWCAECGGHDERNNPQHEYNCPNRNNYDASVTRLAAAKRAAKEFLASYAGTDAGASRMLSIVTFGSFATVSRTWINVAGGSGKNDYDRAVSTIDGLSANGGTNLDDGLHNALGELNGIEAANENVILLTDGVPTFWGGHNGRDYTNDGSGSSGSEKKNSEAKAEADAIKNGGATLYTVCFGASDDLTYTGNGSTGGDGPTVGAFLRDSIATSAGHAYDADNTEALLNAFRAITEDIVSGMSGAGWTATDPMAPMISVTGAPASFVGEDGQTYTWTLDDAQTRTEGDVTYYTYTCTYRVTLDVQAPGFQEGTYYPTNGPTYLNIGDGQTLAFPVPGVTGTLPRTTVTVTKEWNDDNNRDGIRTESVTVQLVKDNTPVEGSEVELNAGNNWTHTWTDLIEMSGGVTHAYTVVETSVPDGYTATVTSSGENTHNLVVTNTHEISKINVEVQKVWNDNNNQDGKRPESITVRLWDGQTQVAEAEITAETGWKHTFNGLTENRDGKPIEYTVTEDEVPGYQTTINGLVITNTHEIEKLNIPVEKVWNDADNQDGIRPVSVTVHLMKGTETVASLTLVETNGWKGTFTGFDKYENGSEIAYTLTEDAVSGYTTTITGDKTTGFTVTNTHAPEKTSVTVTKSWLDSNDQDGIRPADITVALYADDKDTGKTLILSEGNNWTATFTDLDKYADGQVIVYTVKEVTELEGYDTTITGSATDGYVITNSHTPETIEVSGSKIWEDANNQDGVRPESITIRLFADGVEIESRVVTEADGWSWSFKALPKYKDHGTEIVYTITEDAVDDYSTAYSGHNVTNTHAPEKTSVTVTKGWNDNNDQDGIRPDEILVKLLADGEDTGKTLTLNEDNKWSGSFTELDKFKEGVEIQYTVDEVKVDGYTTTVTGDASKGYVVTNTHEPEVVDVNGSKIWNDNNDQDGKRPDSITVNLMKDGQIIESKTVTEADGWAWSFKGLPKFENGGNEIVYTVTENAVEGYSTTYSDHNITNSYTPEQISITVTKAWSDGNDVDGLRPDKITVKLYANGQDTGKTLVLDAEGKWTGSFVGLDKFAGGKLIQYTVGEVAVKGYNTVIRGDAATGFVITNSHTQIPQTGDETDLTLMFALLLISGMALAATGIVATKKRTTR